MATKNPRALGVDPGDTIVTRQDVDTQTPGKALVTAVFAGPGLDASHTGVDAGTGDVTIYLPAQPQVAGQTLTEVIIDEFGRVVGGTFGQSASLSDTGVIAGTYGSPSRVPVYVVDAKGRLSSATNVDIAISTTQITDLGIWSGSSGITTLGTVVTGTWNGSVVDVSHGGTGRSTWTQFGVVFAGTATSLATVTPNMTAAKQFLSMTGTGSAGQAPVWSALSTSDVDDLGLWTGSSNITALGTVVTGIWNATAIAATHGGTGQTVYAVGDILTAGNTTTLIRVADVAAGNVLLSGGVNAVPLYGKVGLASHVAGILPVGFGGTGTATTPSAGQLLVGQIDGTYAAATPTGSPQISVTTGSGSLAISHIESGATAGVYGDGSNIPVLTVNATGHVTGVSTIAINIAGVPTLNQPVNQIAVGNGASGLTSFSGFKYNDTTGVMNIGNCLFGPNQWLAAIPADAFAIGLSMATGEWAFGQNNLNTYMNAKAGSYNVFMVNGVIKGWCNDTKWNLFALESALTVVSSDFYLGYLTTTPGVLTVDGTGRVSSIQVSDSKVAYDVGDTPGYLPMKLQAGAGITMTTVVSGTGKTMFINSRTNSWRPITYATTSTYNVADTDDTIVVNSLSSASTNVVLPVPGTQYAGRLVTVQNAAATGTTLVTSSVSITGATPSMAAAYGKLEFLCINNGSGFVWVCR